MNNPFLTADLRLTEAGSTQVDPLWSHIATYFPYYRMYYVTSGSARMFLFEETLELLPHRLYFIPAFSITGAECDASMTHHWVHFRLDVTTASYLTIYKTCHCISAQEGDEALFRKMCRHYNDSHNGNNVPDMLACVSLAKYFFSRFLPHDSISTQAANFLPVLEYIDAHLASKISNAELSKIMYLNETYFSNVFTKQFGISPKQYTLQKRIAAAASMLLETEKTIKEIAFALGYENEMYFNRIFRKFTGSPPGEYRKSFRNR